ncbi:MAG: O-antigen ligase family protein [Methylocella sp.]
MQQHEPANTAGGGNTKVRPRRAYASPRRIWDQDPIDGALFFALVLALAWVPLWLGANRPFAWGVDAILFPGLALVYEISLLLRGRGHPVGVRRLKAPAMLFAAVVTWIFIQMSTSVPAALQHPVWAMAADVLERPLDGCISVNRDLTALSLLRLATAASALWVSIQLCRDADRAHFLVHAVGAIVAAYCAYGLVSYALFSGAILWFDVDKEIGFVRSTFVNRNSFATYAGLGLVATTGMILRLYRHEVRAEAGSLSHRFALFIEATGRRGWLLLGTGLVTLAALLATGSRGGVAAAALGLIGLLALTSARHRRRGGERMEAVVFVAAAVLACSVFFGDLFIGRIASGGFLDDASRSGAYLITLRSILVSPFLGFGDGTFADVFPMYRDRSIDVTGTWDKAHDTYLEIFQGLGLVFGTALLAALAWLVYLCVAGALKRRRDGGPALVASAAALLIAVHALVDFSVQMQAVALTFMGLLGAGVAQSASATEVVDD